MVPFGIDSVDKPVGRLILKRKKSHEWPELDLGKNFITGS